MAAYSLSIVLGVCAFITGSVCDYLHFSRGELEINIANKLPESLYSSCKLNNSRTGETITCKHSNAIDIKDCNDECVHHASGLIERHEVNHRVFGIWNLIGTIYDVEMQTAFEINRMDGSLVPATIRRVQYRPDKLPNLGYSSCRLENNVGTTIYCLSIQPWVELDAVDCNEACYKTIQYISDSDSIKGNWVLIGQFYYNEDRQTGFEIIVENLEDLAEETTTEQETMTEQETTTEEEITIEEETITEEETTTEQETTTEEVTDVSTTEIHYTDTTTQEVTGETEKMETDEASIALSGTNGICRFIYGQADRVVVEMPRSLATDQDLHFALSLVPMLRQRSLRDKLNTQIDILTYFGSKVTGD